ncbi:hypothetical protein [Halovivax limisalsi]|uniref:hypothetical protein n=1 Tax=Halovivax limisalsi TaxID=1453760 RepID=UPI001FFD6A1E|nr:hypothetical protein [Halovivax limisalsi]
MQFKPVPRPPTDADPIETVGSVHAALPTEADPEIDCCTRVIEQTDVESRDAAGDWLTFLRALELAVAEPEGYRRVTVDGPPEPRRLAARFRDRVVGAADVLDALPNRSEPAIDAAAAFDRLDGTDGIPRSARRRHGDRLEPIWTDRIDRVLRWAVAFGLVERVDGGYRARTE